MTLPPAGPPPAIGSGGGGAGQVVRPGQQAMAPSQQPMAPGSNGATLSYRDEGQAAANGDGVWAGGASVRQGESQLGPLSTLVMPEFWCSIGYFELDTQVSLNHYFHLVHFIFPYVAWPYLLHYYIYYIGGWRDVQGA